MGKSKFSAKLKRGAVYQIVARGGGKRHAGSGS